MPIDAYDPCPCGSGKKFKFCCIAVADDIDKVYKYQEKHQLQSSLQVIERVLATKKDLPWGHITKASLLLQDGDYPGAREALIPLLEKTPDHPFAIALYATAAFASVGYETARPAIYRAFQKSAMAFPDVVGSLSMGIAAWMFSRNKFMGARQHLAQAMRLVPDADKQDIFLRLLEFDSNGDLPYPLRSVHQLVPYSAQAGQDDLKKLAHRAEALVAIGCFEPAAEAYRQLAERDQENARLWQNAGFCAAWNGDEARAAEGLHRAAKLHRDPEAAVECETLAQLLDMNQPAGQWQMTSVRYKVRSVSRLLSMLDEHERILRLPTPSPRPNEPQAQIPPYAILDRPPLAEDPDLWPEPEAIPRSIGHLDFADEPDENEYQLILTGVDGETLHAARELFESIAQEVIESQQEDDHPLIYTNAKELAPLLFTWHFPKKMPVVRQSLLEHQRWEKNVEDIWPNTPLSGLGGKTPKEAKGNAELQIPLKAAIYVLDAFCDRHGHHIDVAALCDRFAVPRPQPIETKPNLPLQSFSAMQLHRLSFPALSDEQLIYVLNRVLLIHHRSVLRDVLLEALSRPSCTEKFDLQRAYNTLADLARDRNDRDDTYRWLSEGQKHAQTLDQSFEKLIRWEMRELAFRAEDPGDPNLMPLVQKLARKYAKKLPQLLDYTKTLLEAYGIDAPANLDEMAVAPGTISSGGIWTPSEQADDTGQKKIWLPGQS